MALHYFKGACQISRILPMYVSHLLHLYTSYLLWLKEKDCTREESDTSCDRNFKGWVLIGLQLFVTTSELPNFRSCCCCCCWCWWWCCCPSRCRHCRCLRCCYCCWFGLHLFTTTGHWSALRVGVFQDERAYCLCMKKSPSYAHYNLYIVDMSIIYIFGLCLNIYTVIYIIYVGYVIHISFYMKPCKSEINNDQHELAVRHCNHQHYNLPTFRDH